MKRYYIIPKGKLPHDFEAGAPYVGEYHFIDLDSHEGHQTVPMEQSLGHDEPLLEDWAMPVREVGTGHRVMVLIEEKNRRGAPCPALPGWQHLPHLLDARTTLGHPKHAQHLKLLQHLPTVELDVEGKPLLGDDGKPKIVRPSAEHGGFELARLLQSIHPMFEP